MLRCFQLREHLQDTELVEVGSEDVEVTYGSCTEPDGFTTLTAALFQILNHDSQVQERLHGKISVSCI